MEKGCFLISVLLTVVIFGCDVGVLNEKGKGNQVVMPVISPASGTRYNNFNVTLSCATEGAEIHYTTDNSEPKRASTLYQKPFEVTHSITLKAKAFKDGWNSSATALAVYEISDVMIYVRGGRFRMGSDHGWNDEKPVHIVTLTGFYISKYELTQKEWVEIMGSNPSYNKGDNLPVEWITWYDAVDYCNKRSILEGLTPCYSIDGDTNPSSWESGTVECDWGANGFRLPTEAEWEYAARGGNMGSNWNYSGDNNIDEVAWYSGNSGNKTHSVGKKKYNELEIYDMSGNVSEWCWDWYDCSYYSSSPPDNPTGPNSGVARVKRGGGYDNYKDLCTVSVRHFSNPANCFGNIGLRLCRSLIH